MIKSNNEKKAKESYNLIIKAISHFVGKEYDKSFSYLSKLSQQYPSSPSILNNVATCSYLNNKTDPDTFFQELARITNLFNSESFASNKKLRKSKDLAIYNQAALCYKYRRYEQAEQLLKLLFDRANQLDEFLALRTCFLLLEIYYKQESYSLACEENIAAILEYLEKTFRSLLVESKASTKTPPASPLRAKLAQMHASTTISTTGNVTTSSSTSAAEEEQLLFLNHLGVFESKSCIYFHRCKYNIMLGNLPAAEKDVNSAVTASCNHSNNNNNLGAVIVQKAFLKMIQKKYTESLELLNQVKGDVSPDIYLNNVGLIHSKLQKHQLALFYFSSAIQEISKAASTPKSPRAEDKKPVRDHSAQIYYNMGLKLLLNAKKYEEAFQCFNVALLEYNNNPRLWIRIAECCIAAHEAKTEEVLKQNPVHIIVKSPVDEQPLVVTLPTYESSKIGLQPYSATNRLDAVLPTSTSETKLLTSPSKQTLGEMSLELADKALRNALALLLSAQSSSASKRTGKAGSLSPDPASAALLQQRHEKRYSELIRCCYLKLAYVSLALENPLVSYSCCKKILADSESSRDTSILALCYMVEALCTMNKLNELYQQLETVEHLLQASPQDPNLSLQESLYINLCVMNIIQRQYPKAQECLLRSMQLRQHVQANSQISRSTFLLQIYLFLASKQEQQAIAFVQKYRHLCETTMVVE